MVKKPDNFEKNLKKIKELLEIVKHKVERVSTSQTVDSIQIKLIKDQVSVVNDKLDEHSDKLDNHTAALMKIEATLEGYADMYKVNKEKTEKLEKRFEVVEDHLGVIPQE